MSIKFHSSFPHYKNLSAEVPVICVTPGEGRVIHRFFDTSPFSPSGRFLAAFRMPFENRPPLPGEKGEIIVIDLETAEEHLVATTAGWETQMGANINWGKDDHTLIFNDVDTKSWEVYGVKLHWPSGQSERFAKGVYHVSPDGRYAVCANMSTMRRTQNGYGVILPDEHVPQIIGLPDDEGIWITDLETLESSLLISLRETVERTASPESFSEYEKNENYFFHTKWNPQGTRIMFSMRRYPHTTDGAFNMICGGDMSFDVFTITPDSKELYNAIDYEKWKNYGHHTNWFPDGEKLSLNLAVDGGNEVKFCQVNYDGSDFQKMFDMPVGSGHPSIHVSGKFLVTDAYLFEPLAFDDGTSPLRLIDLATREETTIARIMIEPPNHIIDKYIELRLDPHPAWDHSWRYLAFNGIDKDTRRVFVADMNKYIEKYNKI